MAVMEIAIEPAGGEPHMHELVARCLEVVERSGMPFVVGPMSTSVQGTTEALLALAVAMLGEARAGGESRLLTTIRIDESKVMEHALDERVRMVEHPAP